MLTAVVMLQLLVGMGRDPITGDPLGRAYPAYKSRGRADRGTHRRSRALEPARRGEAVAAIEAEEAARGIRRAVAGFDVTFSIPKSASMVWRELAAQVDACVLPHGDLHPGNVLDSGLVTIDRVPAWATRRRMRSTGCSQA